MKVPGKLLYEGLQDKGEVFVFYGHNAVNGEPWPPLEIVVSPDSPDVDYMKEKCRLSETTLELKPQEKP